MKKQSLDDDIFDAVLAQAFTEAVAEEFADVPKPEPFDLLPANRQRSRRKRRIRLLAGLGIAVVIGLSVWLVWLGGSPDGYSIETPEYVYGYIPEDYVVTKYRDKGCIGYSFENSIDKTYITINYSPSQWTSFSVDNEFSTITEHSINGNIVYWMTYSKTISNVETLFWNDNYNIFEIYGNVSEKVLFKIAEHITRKPQ
ncbi:MAG: DUF4367 domain-containing protein [Ruminococcaceae bacterium]|nr:DUF4367 domain-containing protein [Oscillospiraceae bacterium]